MNAFKMLTGSAKRIGFAGVMALLLSACVSETETPSFYKSMARVDAAVDQQTAAQMISQYRANNGWGR